MVNDDDYLCTALPTWEVCHNIALDLPQSPTRAGRARHLTMTENDSEFRDHISDLVGRTNLNIDYPLTTSSFHPNLLLGEPFIHPSKTRRCLPVLRQCRMWASACSLLYHSSPYILQYLSQCNGLWWIRLTYYTEKYLGNTFLTLSSMSLQCPAQSLSTQWEFEKMHLTFFFF